MVIFNHPLNDMHHGGLSRPCNSAPMPGYRQNGPFAASRAPSASLERSVSTRVLPNSGGFPALRNPTHLTCIKDPKAYPV